MSSACPHETELAAFASGALGCEERRALEVHLDSCSTCREVCSIAAEPDEHPDDVAPQPRRLGRFTLERLLGAGGLGVVWLAWDPELHRHVAIKILRDRSDDELMRIRREARAMARVSHLNIVAVYEVGQVDGRVFLAMEYVEGSTLRRWIEHERRSWRDVLDACLASGEGLAAAHAAGLVHRDFKPDNVLRGTDGRIRVCDFGLAGELATTQTWPDGNSLASTAAGGTLPYMAPERLQGRAADARSDQFAYCVTVYEALYGQRPFCGESVEALLQAIAAGPPRQGGHVRVHGGERRMRARVHGILTRGLSARPSERYPSLALLLSDLRRATAPRPTASIVLASGAGLVACSALLVGMVPDPCDSVSEELSDAWNDDRRRHMAETFARADAPYAVDTWRTLERELESYADAWTTARMALCEQQAADEGDPTYVLQRLCLQGRRQGFAATLDVLGSGQGLSVERAVEIAEGLSPISECATSPSIGTRPPPSETDAVQIARADEHLARAKALELAGREDEALALAEQAARTSRGLSPHLEVRANLLLARLQKAIDAGNARERMETALLVALEANDSALLARAQLYRSRFEASRGEAKEARQWLQRAEASIGNRNDDPDLVAELTLTRYFVLEAEGGGKPMLAAAREALEAEIRASGPQTLAVATARSNLARALYLEGALDEAQREANAVMALIEGRVGVRHPSWARAAVLVGLTLNVQGKLEEAEHLLVHALDVAEQTLASDHPTIVELLSALISNSMAAQRFEEAVKLSERLLRTLEKHEDARPLQVALARVRLGQALREHGQPERALPYLMRARDALQTVLGADHPRVSIVTVLLADLQIELGNAASVIADLERAVSSMVEDASLTSDLPVARFALARALWLTGGDHRRAHALAREARAGFAALPAEGDSVARVDAWLEKAQ